MSCSEKGCIYPVARDGLCKYHGRLFEVQPSSPRPQSLSALEGIIERGMAGYRAVADALAEIHERKLWREAGYANFVEYCDKRWGLKQCAAYNYLRAKEVVDAMPPEKAATVTLHQAVALARMPEPERLREIRHTDFSLITARKLIDRARHSPQSRNATDLVEFSGFCRKHPELSFWEAVDAWGCNRVPVEQSA